MRQVVGSMPINLAPLRDVWRREEAVRMSETPLEKPEGAYALAPHLVCAGAAEAIDFYKRAFGATEMIRLPGPDGRLVHASVLINGAMVMLVDEFPGQGPASPKALGGTPVTLHLAATDADAVVERAVREGATLIVPVQAMFWGDRYGMIEDPFGHRWSIATPGEKAPRTSEALDAAMRRAGPRGEAGA